MLILHLVDENGTWDDKKEEFVYQEPVTVHLEHSLLSISKWEEKWKVPFMNPHDKNRTKIQIFDYFCCMITDNTPPEKMLLLSQQQIKQIEKYISEEHTATTIRKDENKHGMSGYGKITTSEEVYCWMIEIGIEKSYETWNFSRLMKLIQVYSERNKPKKGNNGKSKQSMANDYAALNARRRKQFGM